MTSLQMQKSWLCCLLPLLLFFLPNMAHANMAHGDQSSAVLKQYLPLAERMRHYRTPGMALAVFTPQGIAWSAGYGLTSREGRPVTGTTRFQAASVSKVVAAASALLLAAKAGLSLDAPLNEHLRSWQLPNHYWGAIPPVTLRQLLSHTAGINVPGFPGYPLQAPLPTLLQILKGQSPATTPAVAVTRYPGSGFHYSGGGTSAVQQLLQDLSGNNYARLARELVLDPCDMEHSGFNLNGVAPDQVALAHNARGEPVAGGWRRYPELAAAGLWSSAQDLAQLGRSLCLARIGHPAAPWPGTDLRVMFTRQAGDRNLAMGHGLFLKTSGTLAFHEGANYGYRCLLLMVPERCEGVAVMTNGENGRGLIMDVLRALADIYHWPGLAPLADPAVTQPPAALLQRAGRHYAGAWRDARGQVIRIVHNNNGLELQLFEAMTPQPLRVLPPHHKGRAPRLLLPDPLEPQTLQRDGDALLLRRPLFGVLRLRRVYY